MKAEIIAVGTELLLGDVIDSNSSYIAKALSNIGIDCYFHTVVGDNAKRLTQAITHASNRAELIIISGGLGPTQDDITKEVVSRILDTPLIDDPESQKIIQERYRCKNESFPSNNLKQSRLLKGASILINDNGIAPGSFLEKNGTYYALLPGVPHEMKLMMDNQLIPKLRTLKESEERLCSRVLRFYQITESQLAEVLDEMIIQQKNPTIAIYVDGPEVTVRLSAKIDHPSKIKQLFDPVEARILDITGEYFYGYGSESILVQMAKQLDQMCLTISIDERGLDGMVVYGFASQLECKSLIRKSNIIIEDQNDQSVIDVEQIATLIKKEGNTHIGLSCVGIQSQLYIGCVTDDKKATYQIDLSHHRGVTDALIQAHIAQALRKVVF